MRQFGLLILLSAACDGETGVADAGTDPDLKMLVYDPGCQRVDACREDPRGFQDCVVFRELSEESRAVALPYAMCLAAGRNRCLECRRYFAALDAGDQCGPLCFVECNEEARECLR